MCLHVRRCLVAAIALVASGHSVALQAQWQNQLPQVVPQHNSAIISNGTISLGVNDEGHLNVDGGTESSGTSPTTVVGVRYLPTNGEATAPGCLCEGWGAADATSGVTGYANINSDGGVNNITLERFTETASEATSVVNIQNVLNVIHFYHPSKKTPFLYEADVTIRNISTADVDLRYRRVMDWDIQPNTFSEFVTIQGAASSPAVLYASNDGFATANPLGSRSDLGSTGDFVDAGPQDHGALFDFTLGTLRPGEARVFTIFYGAAGNEAAALAAIAAVRAEVYSLGQPDVDPGGGAPNTYVFGFAVSKDSDGDGLFDVWEENGAMVDPDEGGPLQPEFVDLPAMGADPQKPDVFIHLDWMTDATHSHQLQAAAIKTVVDAFAAAPYTSPTGSVGINMHVDQGPASIMNYSSNTTWGTLSRARSLTHVAVLGTAAGGVYNWTDFDAIKNEPGGFTRSGRRPIFHYAISGHNYGSTTSSGVSRGIAASDFLVTLGSFNAQVGTTAQQTGTFMHELGHNLALRHGGGDDVNRKPNYQSIMNYFFQMPGVPLTAGGNTFDYSRAALATLDESALDETVGLGAGTSGRDTFHYCAAVPSVVIATSPAASVDWNCDGDATDTAVAEDVNREAATSLTGFDDWANVQLKVGAIGLPGALADLLPMETEEDPLTPELAQELTPLADITPPLPVATLSAQANANGWHQNIVNVRIAALDDAAGIGVRNILYRLEGAQTAPPTTVPGTLATVDIVTEGVTTIVYSASDFAHNTAAERSVTVRMDFTPPTIVVPAGIEVPAAGASGAVVNYSASASDRLDPAVALACAPASGSVFPTGDTTVRCLATDHAGNSATGEFIVRVVASSTPDGLMLGAGHIVAGDTHHHFVFAVRQALNVDTGRLLYWVTEAHGCADDGHLGQDYSLGPGQRRLRFESTSITAVALFDDPAVQPGGILGRRQSPLDTARFEGTGTANGRAGYTFDALAVDMGLFGQVSDRFAITLRDPQGVIVATVTASVKRGEIQSLSR